MKKHIALLFVAVTAVAVWATEIIPGTHDLYIGTRKASEWATKVECVKAAEAQGGGVYGCRNIDRIIVPEPTSSTPTPTVTVTAPPATVTSPFWELGNMPRVDRRTLPAPAAGSSEARIRATSEALETSDIGAFRTACAFSHMNFDDGIVFPGRVGASHLHAYFGNTGSNANSTARSLRESGNSTCLGGVLNRSSYWVPTMVHHDTGRVIAPDNIVVYYKTGYSQLRASDIQPLPEGLRMIAGTSSASGPAPREPWESAPNVFECEATGRFSETVPACPPNAKVSMVVHFPQCWDGVNLDSPDHKSHLSYRVGDAGGRCPATHPVPIPEITFTVRWDTGTQGAAGWRLSSDNYAYSGSNAGYSAHGDWFNGWNAGVSRAWHEGCIRNLKDCKAHLVGNRQMLY